MMRTEWDILTQLDAGTSVLLEASAGTGKTYQIASLVLRLVAELGVSIDRILTLTFTKAATAELRDRVRRRLEEAREVLSGSAPAGERDAVMLALSAGDDKVVRERLGLVEAALASFDLAPISTIHGFSQRMLELFAFESGQESGLELVESADETLEQMVDDALAWAHVETDGRTIGLLQDLGWKRKELLGIARMVTAAVEPKLVPALSGDLGASRGELVKRLEAMVAKAEDFHRWWVDPKEGGRLTAMLIAGYRDFHGWRADWLAGECRRVESWLKSSAFSEEFAHCRASRLLTDQAVAAWKPKDRAFSDQPYFELYERLAGFLEDRDKMLQETRPLLVFAHGLRDRVTAELARRRRLTFDSMLSLLADAIRKEGPQGPLACGIRSRFDVALVDEFQDTDASQWAVLRAVFGASTVDKRMFLIGDPKQAIYAFRGADVFVYLSASKGVGARSTMTTNWRSDGDYVEAMNALWQAGMESFELPATEGRAGIDYVEVRADAQGSRVSGLPEVVGGDGVVRMRRPFEVRWFDANQTYARKRHFSAKPKAERYVAKAVAREALALVRSGATIGLGDKTRPIEPGHIAVLVMKNKQAKLIKRELDALGLPAVVGTSGSVFGTSAAGWLSKWLEAVAAGGSDRPARGLATTPMFGWTAQALAAGLDEGSPEAAGWGRWCDSIARWSRLFERGGFIRAFEAALAEYEVMARILGTPDGERHATDLRHLAELAHLESRTRELGPDELAAWLKAEAPDDADKAERSDERSQRLESDARAIQVTTIHASKGLEYPIVLLPFSWETENDEADGPLLWHDPGHAEQPVLDLRHVSDPQRAAAESAYELEVRQEKARLLYVALTRAAHHTVAWVGSVGKGDKGLDGSALGRLLMRTQPGIAFGKPDSDEAMFARVGAALDAVVARSKGTIGWGVGTLSDGVDGPVADEVQSFEARAWTGRDVLRSERMVSSFTRLAKPLEAEDEEPELEAAPVIIGAAEAEPEPGVTADAIGQSGPDGAGGIEAVDGSGVLDEPEEREGLADGHALSGLEGMWGGKAVGTWVHGVLEELDFTTGLGKLGEPVEEVVLRTATRAGVVAPPDQAALLTGALGRILSTPLGGGLGVARLDDGLSLSSLRVGDRLDELRFDLRVDATKTTKGLPELLADAMRLRVAEDWVGRSWLEDVTRPGVAPLLQARSGVLVGSIDLVFRVPDADGDARYFISDFKTNRILSHKEPRGSQRRHYTPRWMAWEMGRHAYHLQALIYTVALHRFLSQRVRGYDYDRHVGGHLYLFLRGMEGADTPVFGGMRLGVFQDRWPREVVLAVDAALDGRFLGGAS